jgi:hypothetical protein
VRVDLRAERSSSLTPGIVVVVVMVVIRGGPSR